MAANGTVYMADLQKMTRLPFSAIAPSDIGNSSALRTFIDTPKPTLNQLDIQIGRVSTHKAEDPAYFRAVKMVVMGVIRADASYVNIDLLPAIYTKDTRWSWKKKMFIPKPLVPVPAEGVSEVNEVITTEHEARSARYGQSWEMDKETFFTPQGQEDFALEMTWWSSMFTQSMEQAAWEEIVSDHPDRRRAYFERVSNPVAFDQAVTQWRDDTFAPYKGNFYEWMQKQFLYVKSKCQRPVTVVVMPQDKTPLITTGPMTEYAKTGNRGVDMLMSRGELPEIVPGVKVAPQPIFQNGPEPNGEGPLNNNIRIGDYVQLKFHKKVDADEDRFQVHDCMNAIYVDSDDQMQIPIALPQFLKHSGRFELEMVGGVGTNDATDKYVISNLALGVEDVQDPFRTDGAIGKAEAGKAHTLSKWADICQAAKCRYIAVFPFRGYRTQGMLFAAGGEAAGFTAVTEPFMSAGENAPSQFITWTMTAWIGPVIVDDRSFQLIRNVFLNGILGGTGIRPIEAAEVARLRDETMFVNNDLHRASMYCMVVGQDGEINSNYIDLRGHRRFAPNSPTTYPCAEFNTQHFGFDRIEDNERDPLTLPIAPICFRRFHNVWNGTQFVPVPGNGFFGPVEGVGCQRSRLYGTSAPTMQDLTLVASY